MWPDPPESLVTFTEETLNVKFIFYVVYILRKYYWLQKRDFEITYSSQL